MTAHLHRHTQTHSHTHTLTHAHQQQQQFPRPRTTNASGSSVHRTHALKQAWLQWRQSNLYIKRTQRHSCQWSSAQAHCTRRFHFALAYRRRSAGLSPHRCCLSVLAGVNYLLVCPCPCPCLHDQDCLLALAFLLCWLLAVCATAASPNSARGCGARQWPSGAASPLSPLGATYGCIMESWRLGGWVVLWLAGWLAGWPRCWVRACVGGSVGGWVGGFVFQISTSLSGCTQRL